MEQYWENKMMIITQDNPKSKFRKFINSFLVDTADIHSSNFDCGFSPCDQFMSLQVNQN